MATSLHMLDVLLLLAGCFVSSNVVAINHWVATKEGTIQAHVSLGTPSS